MEVEVTEVIVEIIVVADVEAPRPQIPTTPIPIPTNLVIRVPNIRTFPQASGRGALYIINSGEELIFVRNLPRVHGKMFLRHAHKTNETVANPSTNLST